MGLLKKVLSKGPAHALFAQSRLSTRHLDANGKEIKGGRRTVINKVVTDVFVQDVIDSLVAAAYINDFKYHDSGTGTTAEAADQTALVTATGVARVAGSQAEGASANIYKTIATITYDGAYDVTEHAVFDASTSGIMFDRSVFGIVTVANGEKIEFTYEFTLSSGG